LHYINNNTSDRHKIIEISNKTMDNKNSSKNDENFNNKNFLSNNNNKITNFKNSTHPLIKLPIIYLFHQTRKMIILLIIILLIRLQMILLFPTP